MPLALVEYALIAIVFIANRRISKTANACATLRSRGALPLGRAAHTLIPALCRGIPRLALTGWEALGIVPA